MCFCQYIEKRSWRKRKTIQIKSLEIVTVRNCKVAWESQKVILILCGRRIFSQCVPLLETWSCDSELVLKHYPLSSIFSHHNSLRYLPALITGEERERDRGEKMEKSGVVSKLQVENVLESLLIQYQNSCTTMARPMGRPAIRYHRGEHGAIWMNSTAQFAKPNLGWKKVSYVTIFTSVPSKMPGT